MLCLSIFRSPNCPTGCALTTFADLRLTAPVNVVGFLWEGELERPSVGLPVVEVL